MGHFKAFTREIEKVSRRFNNFTHCLTRLTKGSFSSKPTYSNKKPRHNWQGFLAPPAGLEPATL